MNEDEATRLFSRAADSIPPIPRPPAHELIQRGKRVQRRNRLLSVGTVAAVVALIIGAGAAWLPGFSGSAQPPTANNPTTPTELELLGQWRVVGELEQQLQSAGFPDESKVLEFGQRDGNFWWGGSDECNAIGGRFTVGAEGALSTPPADSTAVFCPPFAGVTVPEAVSEAARVRLVAGQLQLFDEEDSLLATFERLEVVSTTPTESDLFGQWRVVGELEQQLQSAGLSDASKILGFSHRDKKFLWVGNDECNLWSGQFEVGADGAFSANGTFATQAGCPSAHVATVPEVVKEATGVRLISGQLQLLDDEDSLLATFERYAPSLAPTPPPGTTAATTPIPLSTSSWEPGDDSWRAIVGGRIALSKDGCVYFERSGGATDVIWPAGYSADINADGVLTLRNPAGEPVGYEGTRISTGGGGLSEDEGGIPDEVLRLLECQVTESVVIIHDVLPTLAVPTTPSPAPTQPPTEDRVRWAQPGAVDSHLACTVKDRIALDVGTELWSSLRALAVESTSVPANSTAVVLKHSERFAVVLRLDNRGLVRGRLEAALVGSRWEISTSKGCR